MLRNSRPLQLPKPPRGSKAGYCTTGTGAEGHAELRGNWEWVACFDPDDYESTGGPAGTGYGLSAMGEGAVVSATAASGETLDRSPGRLVTGSPQGGSSASAVDFSSPSPLASSPTLAMSAGGVVDLARSLGWRSVSTAGDEEDDAYASASSSAGGDRGTVAPDNDNEDTRTKSPLYTDSPSVSPAAAAAAAGVSAAVGSYAAVASPARTGVTAREALLAVLGRLFQQCSVYLEPCEGDPLWESRPLPGGGAQPARVQLQLVRREERALKTMVQPEVRVRECDSWRSKLMLDGKGEGAAMQSHVTTLTRGPCSISAHAF